jgi:O-antigen biosynthesis protein
MIDFLRAVRFYLIPRDSRREKVYHAIRVVLLSLKLYGLRITARQIRLAVRSLILDRREGLGHGILYTYQDWIRKTEPDSRALARQRSQAREFRYRPLICILTPVYNPAPDVLRETIQSVIEQTYDHWELWLANASDKEGVREVIDGMAARDARIRPLHLEHNLGIAGNTNQALQAAQGEYIALLDHDDLLSANTLYEAVQVLNARPETDLVYYDEDKVWEDGKSRRDPWFKPSAYSPDLLISNNYLMHAIIRKSLVEELGGFDAGVDGAQDWDLSLKIAERTSEIVHVPKVLYHWRQVEGSAARDANAKPWAFAAQERTIRNALKRQGYADIPVSFEGLGVIRVHWPTGSRRAIDYHPNP